MENLKNFFPLNARVQQGNATSLLTTIILYIVISAVIGVFLGLINWLPLIGWIFRILGSLVGLYSLIGIILAIVTYTQK